jgi:hypothetical protein
MKRNQGKEALGEKWLLMNPSDSQHNRIGAVELSRLH